jgi:hypothetical protein
MALTSTIRRAPKWAWMVGGGVGLGAAAIQVYRHRAVDTPAAEDASGGAQVIGTPSGGSAAPSPVITPPVIIAPSSDGPDYAGLFATFGDALNNAVGTVGQLAAGDQGLAQTSIGMVGQLAGGAQDLAREAIAQAGQAPQPIAVAPTPVIVNVPTAATPAIISPPAKCPAAFPHYNAARGLPSPSSCYKSAKTTPANKQYPCQHVYQNGNQVRSPSCP